MTLAISISESCLINTCSLLLVHAVWVRANKDKKQKTSVVNKFVAFWTANSLRIFRSISINLLFNSSPSCYLKIKSQKQSWGNFCRIVCKYITKTSPFLLWVEKMFTMKASHHRLYSFHMHLSDVSSIRLLWLHSLRIATCLPFFQFSILTLPEKTSFLKKLPAFQEILKLYF